MLDHVRASRALNHLSSKLRRLSFIPKRNLHVICSFQQLMTKFCGFYGPLPGKYLLFVFLAVLLSYYLNTIYNVE